MREMVADGLIDGDLTNALDQCFQSK